MPPLPRPKVQVTPVQELVQSAPRGRVEVTHEEGPYGATGAVGGGLGHATQPKEEEDGEDGGGNKVNPAAL